MTAFVQALRLGTITVLLGGLIGCDQLAQSGLSVSNIRDIQNKRDTSPLVYLKGKVTSQAKFLNNGAYQLQDGTGKVWVITNQMPIPNSGDEILIQGKVEYESIPLAGKDLGEVYIQEQQRLEYKPVEKKSN